MLINRKEIVNDESKENDINDKEENIYLRINKIKMTFQKKNSVNAICDSSFNSSTSDGKTIHLDFVSNLYVLYSFIFTFSVTLHILFKSLIIFSSGRFLLWSIFNRYNL